MPSKPGHFNKSMPPRLLRVSAKGGYTGMDAAIGRSLESQAGIAKSRAPLRLKCNLPKAQAVVTIRHIEHCADHAMSLPRQTTALLDTARELVRDLRADAVLLLTETNLDWEAVLERLQGCRLLVAAQD